jgi:predicted acyl esterase
VSPVTEAAVTPYVYANRHNLLFSVVTRNAVGLIARGITTLVYNSRGTGSSTGRASWTGEAERRDYGAVVEWLVTSETKSRALITDRVKLLCCVSLTFHCIQSG